MHGLVFRECDFSNGLLLYHWFLYDTNSLSLPVSPLSLL